MKIKLVNIITLMIVSFFTLVGCSDERYSAAELIEIGKEAIEKMEYDKAVSFFQEARKKGINDGEVNKLINIINDYKEAIKQYNAKRYEVSKEILSNIDEDYIKYQIRIDIGYLKNLTNGNNNLNN